MRLCVAPPLAAEITGGFRRRSGLPFSAINRRLRFRANGKMAKGWIPAYAGMTARVRRLISGGLRRNIRRPAAS